MAPTLAGLPNEVLTEILTRLPPAAVPTLQRVSRRFSDLSTPLIWRFHCQTHFKFWAPEHDFKTRLAGNANDTDWKALYVKRFITEQQISQSFDSFLSSTGDRIKKAHVILDPGLDGKDALLRWRYAPEATEDVLARRYWAAQLLDVVHRSQAIDEWWIMRDGGEVPLERALGCFDMFAIGDRQEGLDEITAELDKLANGFIAEHAEYTEMTPRKRAVALLKHLRSNRRIGIRGSDANLQINFIGRALFDPSHASLPLIDVAIYCSVAKRVGLDVRPMALPYHVCAILESDGQFTLDGKPVTKDRPGLPMYLDPARASTEVDLEDIRSLLKRFLNMQGVGDQDHEDWLQPTPTIDIVQRCANNIVSRLPYQDADGYGTYAWGAAHDKKRDHGPPVRDYEAGYAAAWSDVVLIGDGLGVGLLIQMLESLTRHFFHDHHIFVKRLRPTLPHRLEHQRDFFETRAATQDKPQEPKRRTKTRSGDKVQYPVGQYFQHARYGYHGFVCGWDPECAASSYWIDQMGVDRLSKGRKQSFYNVVDENGGERYVAQENIRPINGGHPSEQLQFLAGEKFKRWDVSADIFISNIKDEYPDD